MPRGRQKRPSPDLGYADTNLFVALLAGPTHPFHDEAVGIFRRVADGELALIVTNVVVAELVYVMRSLAGWTRRATAGHIGLLLEADGLVVSERSVIVRALHLFGGASRLDFADAYLAAAALELGPDAIVSFDRDFDSVDAIRRISA